MQVYHPACSAVSDGRLAVVVVKVLRELRKQPQLAAEETLVVVV